MQKTAFFRCIWRLILRLLKTARGKGISTACCDEFPIGVTDVASGDHVRIVKYVRVIVV